MPTQEEFFSAVAEDVIRVTKVDATRLTAALNALRTHPGYLSGGKAIELLANHVSEIESQEAIRNLVFALHEWVNESSFPIEELANSFKSAWKESHQERQGELPEATFDECLRKLVGPFPPIERQANAVRVSNLAGNRASSVSFVTDLRPVYRQPQRDQIEGMIPLTTMVVNFSNASGGEGHLEVVLSNMELDRLIKEAQVAKGKMSQLVELAQSANKEVPELTLTRNTAEDVTS